MSFRQFQLVQHILTGRTGRIMQSGDGQYALVTFGNYDELIDKDELDRAPEYTVSDMIRGALGDYRNRHKYADQQLKTDKDSFYIYSLLGKANIQQHFRNHLFRADSPNEEE